MNGGVLETTTVVTESQQTGSPSIRSCPCCGLVMQLPAKTPTGHRLRCPRCHHRIHRQAHTGVWCLSLTLTALTLYPLAITLPVLELSRFGHVHTSSVLGGGMTLLGHGELLVGLVVLGCSVVIPALKLLGLLILSLQLRLKKPHLALTWRAVEFTGRWGMVDVLLVAVLVAALKLGDLVSVKAGPGALVFTLMVGASLLASAAFNPHSIANKRTGEASKETP